jgi:hypothetical protein
MPSLQLIVSTPGYTPMNHHPCGSCLEHGRREKVKVSSCCQEAEGWMSKSHEETIPECPALCMLNTDGFLVTMVEGLWINIFNLLGIQLYSHQCLHTCGS